jgi:hypothetical protein
MRRKIIANHLSRFHYETNSFELRAVRVRIARNCYNGGEFANVVRQPEPRLAQ